MRAFGENINYQSFIEDNFLIKNKDGIVVPFLFDIFQEGQIRSVQDYYMVDLYRHYGDELEGVRDIVLKGRKEGFSAMILGMFATDFLMSEHPIGCVSIADTKEETQRLLSRAKFFIESAAIKENSKLTDICDIVSKNQLRNKWNGAEFWIGTAGSKVALRTETVQDLHFSEAAYFADTDIITATETIEGALQMVPQGKGKVFIESTANGYGNYYQDLWDKASLGESTFRPVFYGADQFYSKEWLAIKEIDFTTREMFWQEYPNSPGQAFISSGSKFFDTEAILWLQKEVVRKPLIEGNLNIYGEIV